MRLRRHFMVLKKWHQAEVPRSPLA
jgi:hypothetical protein